MAAAVTLVGVGVRARRHGRFGATLLVRTLLLLAVGLTGIALQRVFDVPPPPLIPDDPYGYPSGHVTVVAAVAMTAILICWRALPDWRWKVATVETTAVLLVMTGRVAQGEHYLRDVVGAVCGVVGLTLLAALALRILPPPTVACANQLG